MKKQTRRHTEPQPKITIEQARKILMGLAKLEVVKGLLFADESLIALEESSPLDNQATREATYYLMCEGLDAIHGTNLHDFLLDKLYNPRDFFFSSPHRYPWKATEEAA